MADRPTAPPRLPWKRDEYGGFTAMPNGEHAPKQRAHLWQPDPPSWAPNTLTSWHWLVDWPDRFRKSGECWLRQEAADAATEAWWAGIAEANDRERALRPYELFAERLFGGGRAEWHLIELTTAPYDELMKIMAKCRRDGAGSGFAKEIEAVMGTLSKEFHRRRLAGETDRPRRPGQWDVRGN